MLDDLDWQTKFSDAEMRPHWRMFVCALIGSMVSVPIWFYRFPHTFHWFWAGAVTGAFVGVFPGIVWQIRDNVRRSATSGRLTIFAVVAWGFMSLFALFDIGPQLAAEEQMRTRIRTLTAEE